jgi:hypothetical protein
VSAPAEKLTSSEIIPEFLNVQDWAEIRSLHRSEGMAVKAIARRMGCRRTRPAAAACDLPAEVLARVRGKGRGRVGA